VNLYFYNVGFVIWLFFFPLFQREFWKYIFFDFEIVFMQCGIRCFWWACSPFHIFKDIFGVITSDLWNFWRFVLWFLWIFFVLWKHTTHFTCVVFQMKKWKWLEVRNKDNLFLECFFLGYSFLFCCHDREL